MIRWSVALQAPLSIGLSRQEYWSRLPFPSPRDLPNPGIEPRSPALAGRFFAANTTFLMNHLINDYIVYVSIPLLFTSVYHLFEEFPVDDT